MKQPNIKRIAFPVAVWFFIYSISGCGGSNNATKHLDKYDALTYQDVTVVNASKDNAYKSAILALQQRGYVVTLSDPQTGLINTEINSADKIPEEQKADQAATSNGSSTGSVLLGILSIVLIFGIVLMLVGSSKDKTKDNNSSTSSNLQASSSEPSKTTSYKYILTLTTTALTDTTTQFQISAVRMVLENGSVIQSGKFENKYLNYSVFDALYDQLDREDTDR